MASIVLQFFYFSKYSKDDVTYVQNQLLPQYASQVTNILIVSSSPRTGSSFTAEMIASSNKASYFFEPLWYYIDANIQPKRDMKENLIKNLLRCNIRDPTIKDILFSNKRSRFVFRKPSLTDIKRFSLLSRVGIHQSYIHKMESKCRKTSLRVVKTFRMTVREVSDLIESLPDSGSSLTRKNTFLLHLVRDPRGIINSIQSRANEWPDKFEDAEYVCSRILNESYLMNLSSVPSYLTTVRYEDIASEPWSTLVNIFSNMNLTVPRESRYFVQKHSSIHIPLPPLKNNNDNKENKLFNFVAEGKLFNQDQIFQTAEKDNQDKEKSIVNDNNTDNNDKSVDDHNDVIVVSDNDGNEEPGKSENDHNVSDLISKGNDGNTEKSGQENLHKRQKRFVDTIRAHAFDVNSKIKKVKAKTVVVKNSRENYFSTYRDKKKFSPNHWRQTLNSTKLEQINSNVKCKSVFEIYKYPFT